MNVPVILVMETLLAQTMLVHMLVNATLAILEMDIIAQVSQKEKEFYENLFILISGDFSTHHFNLLLDVYSF